MNSKNFSLKKTIWYFVTKFSSVTKALEHQHDPSEYRLFTDSSKVSLKAVLLHNGNKFPYVSLAHATNMKESYENMKLLLEKIQFEIYT